MVNKENFSHAATVFPVRDLQNSMDFYTKKLDFNVTFSWGSPVTYAVLKRGGVSLHLTRRNDELHPSKEHCALYVFVHDVDEIYQRCVKENVTISSSPGERDYKMKDFDITDPDGYIITFGKGG